MPRRVTEDVDAGTVNIDGLTIEGLIVDDSSCTVCRGVLVYFDRHDASFCPQCNEWKEGACDDGACMYCARRPSRPLPLNE